MKNRGGEILKDRLKTIRKSLTPKISQEKFGEMFGVSRNAIKTYELGTVIPSDTFIQLLCSKLNINEVWLRTGAGTMLEDPDRDEAIVAWAAKLSRDNYNNKFEKRLASLLASLSEKEWAILEEKTRFLFTEEKKTRFEKND